MTAPEPGQAAYEAAVHSLTDRAPNVEHVPWDRLDETEPWAEGYCREDFDAAAQAAIDAATEGTLRALSYTLADVARFIEAQSVAAPAAPQPAPLSVPWRQGRAQPRNVYARTGGNDWKADLMIGHLDTAALAAEAVRAHNDALSPAKPAPELAAAMAEARRYRQALEHVRAIILEGDNSTEASRLRRSRAVIRAALEGK